MELSENWLINVYISITHESCMAVRNGYEAAIFVLPTVVFWLKWRGKDFTKIFQLLVCLTKNQFLILKNGSSIPALYH